MLNLSGSQDVDTLKLTDLIASEFQSFPNLAVVPVNRAVAYLASRGKAVVETPADAVDLAQAFGADAAIVVALTEYSAYDPPVVGLIMQWYEPPRAADESATAMDGPAGSSLSAAGPRWQLQRVFNAADEEVLEEVRHYASDRDGHESPYGWRRYVKSQEWYVRYCGWAVIKRLLKLVDVPQQGTRTPHEAMS